jgi:hypothetical protein
MSSSSIVHSIVVERTYRTGAARVFAAFADPVITRRWFAEGEGWQVEAFTVDFREGGRGISSTASSSPSSASSAASSASASWRKSCDASNRNFVQHVKARQTPWHPTAHDVAI